ncbi:hypothetical protein GOBAR_AA12757 [Gossypium barbadense]|uniref:Uncharacterized protein n=1 Tax=Gossypium barbadense TaxID=3634 RepID=A0A2P5XX34_GOSBA|nr:hypothetical protein GOBAR_AA12757 [Gossypium barbadense]
MISDRAPGNLPSNTEPNPEAHVKVVTLRSGKVLAESEKSHNKKLTEAKERRFTTQTRPSTQACLKPCGNRAKIFPNTGYDKSPWPCDMAVGEPAKTTLAFDTSVPGNRG